METIVDVEYLQLLAGDDRAAVLAIVLEFKVDAAGLLTRCAKGLDSGSVKECRELIHTLKGSVGALGFKVLYERCLVIERSGFGDFTHAKIVELETLVDESVEIALGLLG